MTDLKQSLTILLISLGSAVGVVGAEGEWVKLFDGKTLDGWVQKNGTATYRVEDGTITGETAEGSPNSFLCTKRDYSDFELEFDVREGEGSSVGISFRPRFGYRPSEIGTISF